MSEEEKEQIWEFQMSDSELETPWYQPLCSTSPSSASVFPIYPQPYFSQPPPLTPQPHFSPPPSTSILRSPDLDFSSEPSSIRYITTELVTKALRPMAPNKYIDGLSPGWTPLLEIFTFEGSAIANGSKLVRSSTWLVEGFLREVTADIYHTLEIPVLRIQSNRNTRSSPRLVEDSLPDICIDVPLEAPVKVLNEFPGRQRLKLNSDVFSSLLRIVPKPRKISRKSSIQPLQVLPSVQLSQTLQSMRDCPLVEERSVEIAVEVDATNNGAHGVKAYENFPIVSHSEKKNTRDKLKRNYKSISVLTWEDLQQHFGSKREDVAKSFGVSVSTLKRICRQHGISRWPFQPERKKERLMEVISPSMPEKHDLRLRCIQTPLHARSSPQTIALLDGGEMVQLDSSKQQSLVEFDVTNNSAHLVRASQSCSTVSHSDETNSRETLKRKCTTESVLSFEDLQQHFGYKLDDAAKALGVSVSTVKRTCRQHGIPQWPSQKKKKASKTDCILLEPQGEKDVSPTCRKMPTDRQTGSGNEMVGYLEDQNEGPNLLNTENGSNEESITTPIFQDSVPVFERDCILLEPQGEKNVSPTHKTPTNGQTEVGNGMVGHIQDQNGIVPEFIEGPNLLNTENRSNGKSLTTPNFQDSVPGNYPAMDFSISSTYRESGEAGGSSELAFQPKELTPSTAYPNPNACVFTQPHTSLREMLIENVGSSRDSRNFSTSAVGAFMGGHVSEPSRTVHLCSDPVPMQTMTTIPHTMPHLTEKQDMRTVTFKAQYRHKKIKFRLSLPSGIVELKKQVTNRLGELGSFEVHYQDNDNEWILIGCDTDVRDCFELSSSSGNEVVRLLVCD